MGMDGFGCLCHIRIHAAIDRHGTVTGSPIPQVVAYVSGFREKLLQLFAQRSPIHIRIPAESNGRYINLATGDYAVAADCVDSDFAVLTLYRSSKLVEQCVIGSPYEEFDDVMPPWATGCGAVEAATAGIG